MSKDYSLTDNSIVEGFILIDKDGNKYSITNPFPFSMVPFYPASVTSTQTISCSTSNAQNTLFTGADLTSTSLRIYNSGAVPVCVRWGTGAQTATTSDMQIAPGSVEVFYKGTANGFAAITASGIATLSITPGIGS